MSFKIGALAKEHSLMEIPLNIKFAFLPVLLLAFLGLECDTVGQERIDGLRNRLKEHVLSNGMRFLLLENHESPTVSFHIYYGVGSVDEQTGHTGIAHLYEHMAFKGTKQIGTTDYEAESRHFDRIDRLEAEITAEQDKGNMSDGAKISRLEAQLKKEQNAADRYVVPNEIGKLYERNGGTGLQAQTERDETHYSVNLPSNKIELWMAIESDRFQHAVLRQFYEERDVVMEEMRQTIDTEPFNRLLLQETITTAFHAHPYGLHSGIGWASDVSHLTRAEVQAFFNKYYGAANCTVAIVGDFDTATIIRMIDRYFSSVPAGEKNRRLVTVEPAQEGERRVELEVPTQPSLVLGYHRGDVLSIDSVLYDVVASLLAGGHTSRLYKALVLDKKIATGVEVLANPPLVTAKYPSLFEIIAQPVLPIHNVGDLEKAIYAEIDKLKEERVDNLELRKITNQAEAEFVRSMANNETLARELAFTEGLEGDWRRLLTYRQRLADVTPEDIMRVAKELFRKSNRTVAYIVPK
jgi:predicted Zn-dependent peptidase